MDLTISQLGFIIVGSLFFGAVLFGYVRAYIVRRLEISKKEEAKRIQSLADDKVLHNSQDEHYRIVFTGMNRVTESQQKSIAAAESRISQLLSQLHDALDDVKRLKRELIISLEVNEELTKEIEESKH